MSTLIGSARTVDNVTMRARVTAAVQRSAPAKAEEDGRAARLAAQAIIDPASLVAHFMARVAVDSAVSSGACHDCGYSDTDDTALLAIVGGVWDDVAAVVFPSAD